MHGVFVCEPVRVPATHGVLENGTQEAIEMLAVRVPATHQVQLVCCTACRNSDQNHAPRVRVFLVLRGRIVWGTPRASVRPRTVALAGH